ncbi:MAG: glycosyltransferase family 4 protein [Gemmataceae bacterium]|nr:glycosyltransferase family 4 protein [Gemmataceae bacterium]
MRVALLGANAQKHDAIGNQIAEKLAFFLDRGTDVRVFLSSLHQLHPDVHGHAECIDVAPGGAGWQFLASADLVLIDYSQDYPLLALLPLLAGGKPRVIVDYHGVTPSHLGTRPQREGLDNGARRRALVWCADAALVHSRAAQRELRDATGFARLFHLGHPVDTHRFTRDTESHSLRNDLKLPDATLLLFVGRLAPNKRVPILIEALALLRERSPAVHAVVIGDDRGVYGDETLQCRRRAEELGVADRLHILGQVGTERLYDAYRSADVFVMPSLHEGFCVPVLEAMASGLPVIAARAAALPETIGDAGLTFAPEDATDLARQVDRVLDSRRREPEPIECPLRVAIVAGRYGVDFVGGAETSLRTIGEALHQAGHQVEVFTTCLADEDALAVQATEGTGEQNGIPVHRFGVDPIDREKYLKAREAVEDANGLVSPAIENDFLEHSVRSSHLLAALDTWIDSFDAVIVGPYLLGFTADVARRFAAKVLLLPCFHDEPAARLNGLREAYEQVGGILYHSREEQEFAQSTLGLNHPGATLCGTVVDQEAGDAARGRERVGARRYVLYCGRFAPRKNVPKLLDYARRYAAEHPDRFRFAFVGQGCVPLPRENWLRDLGFVDARTRRDVVAGAAAVLQLSERESLSLAVLEAGAQAVPVLVNAQCDVLAGYVRRSNSGQAVDEYESFAGALDDLWQRPEHWRGLGTNGQRHVRAEYGCRQTFTARLVTAIEETRQPLAERMIRRGRGRAERFARCEWRKQFGAFIEEWLDTPGRQWVESVLVQPRGANRTVPCGLDTVLLPVRVQNHGSHALTGEGPTRVVLRARIENMAAQAYGSRETVTPLPDLLMPKQELFLSVLLPVPAEAGDYQVVLRAERPDASPELPQFAAVLSPEAKVTLAVVPAGPEAPARFDSAVQTALVEAERMQRLPDDYTDVTLGRFAAWKHWIKQKLLNNFKRAYVDVLSRQQSAFNRQMLTAVHELAEGHAVLAHALERGGKLESSAIIEALRKQLAASERRIVVLEERLARQEAQEPQEEVPS